MTGIVPRFTGTPGPHPPRRRPAGRAHRRGAARPAGSRRRRPSPGCTRDQIVEVSHGRDRRAAARRHAARRAAGRARGRHRRQGGAVRGARRGRRRDLELTSFVRPDRVPAMADAAELAAVTAGHDGVTRWALVLNTKGAQRAVAAGHRPPAVRASACPTPTAATTPGAPPMPALAELDAIRARLPADVAVRGHAGHRLRLPVRRPGRPRTTSARPPSAALAAGVAGVSLADTIGTAIPSEVAALVRRRRRRGRRPPRRRPPPRHPRARHHQRPGRARCRRPPHRRQRRRPRRMPVRARAPAATCRSRTSSTCSSESVSDTGIDLDAPHRRRRAGVRPRRRDRSRATSARPAPASERSPERDDGRRRRRARTPTSRCGRPSSRTATRPGSD